MSEMIERVARAIYAAEGNTRTAPGEPTRPMTLEDEPEDERAIYFDYARAAIEAMREPTDSLLAQAMQSDDVVAWGDYKQFWEAMIEAALK